MWREILVRSPISGQPWSLHYFLCPLVSPSIILLSFVFTPLFLFFPHYLFLFVHVVFLSFFSFFCSPTLYWFVIIFSLLSAFLTINLSVESLFLFVLYFFHCLHFSLRLASLFPHPVPLFFAFMYFSS